MKVGILAAGVIAKKMAYTLNHIEETECYAVASRSLEKAEKFAEENHVEKAYGSYEELAEDPEVELVYIASPHSHHYEHAKMCLEHGKHVLVEKAFTANAAQAEELIRLGREKGLLVAEAIWTRYLPTRKMIDEIIASGEIGEVSMVTANLGYDIRHIKRLYDPNLAGGALLDVGVYPLNFIAMVLGGEVQSVQTCCTKYETGVDAQNVITLTYPDGVMATAHSSILGGTDQMGIVYGSKGYLVAHGINNVEKISIYDNWRRLIREVERSEQINGFEDEVRSCVRAIREGKTECPEMPHAESIRMMKLMDTCRNAWGIRFPFE